MPGLYFLTIVLIANSGISQHTPAVNVPTRADPLYTWDQCQFAGKSTIDQLELRNVHKTFTCTPTPNTSRKPVEENK